MDQEKLKRKISYISIKCLNSDRENLQAEKLICSQYSIMKRTQNKDDLRIVSPNNRLTILTIIFIVCFVHDCIKKMRNCKLILLTQFSFYLSSEKYYISSNLKSIEKYSIFQFLIFIFQTARAREHIWELIWLYTSTLQ